MLGAINRMDASARDWNQANQTTMTNTEKTPNESRDVSKIQSMNQQTEAADGRDKDKIHKEIEKLNEQMKSTNKLFRFKYSEEADKFYVQIIDARSQEVIDSLPPEYMLDLSAKLNELIGLFVDKKL
ncbi:hypothetical protein PAECIP111893_00363 [Paenibacillus plantiphilus]|uniref:Flagellar protein FlaG n=1 Tax=Paenibacillus plantiphilus TaxID=2905650 RepID=A0ABN8FVZ8_9BACL|nr:flagellar protein FlaG [Paenibacillus plantiphilus]CAH1192976.1 hypothetical protein PAECIP111893_00363 [Paenibacillus plantiphilus]